MSALIDYIQKEIHNTYKRKYSKKYIKDKLVPIINYICSSKSKKFLFGGSQGIGKSSFINIISKTIEKFYNKKILLLSLDNYYLSRKQRLQLSKKIHPNKLPGNKYKTINNKFITKKNILNFEKKFII